MGQPPQQPPYGPGPYGPYQPQPQVIVKRGLHPAWHAVHAVATLLTCGFWSPIWFVHWLVGRGNVKVTYR